MLKSLRVFSGQSNHATLSITIKEHIKVIRLSRSQARIRKFPKFMTGYIQPGIPTHTYSAQPNSACGTLTIGGCCLSSPHGIKLLQRRTRLRPDGSLGKDSDCCHMLPYLNLNMTKVGQNSTKKRTRSDGRTVNLKILKPPCLQAGPPDVQQQVI